MRFTISGEYLDGDNFTGTWLGIDADNLDLNEANEAEVLDAIIQMIRGGSYTTIRLNNGDIWGIFPDNISRIKVTGIVA